MAKKVTDVLGKSMFKVGVEYKLQGETTYNVLSYTVLADDADKAVQGCLDDMREKNVNSKFVELRMFSVDRKGTIDLIVG